MRKLLFIPVLAALAALASISLVDAHSRPVRFDPDPGEVLSSAPSEVTGWFTSDIRRADESFVHVLDHDGAEVQTGEAQLSTDRRQMSTALQTGLAAGRYVVYWSTLDDADGEVFTGCYAFFVGQAAADEAVEHGEALDGGGDCPATAKEAEHTHEEGEEDPNAASVAISIPEVVDGGRATLEITPANFTPREPDGSTVDPSFGHYHIYLDKVPVDVLTGHSPEEGADHEDDASGSTGTSEEHEDDTAENPGGLVENPVMWTENSYTFTNLEPGYHTVSVVLNHDDHTPLSPAVVAAQTFRVEDNDSGSLPVWALALGVIAGLVVGGVGVKLASSRA
jgi:methionine-rich copper-binding protein CopC